MDKLFRKRISYICIALSVLHFTLSGTQFQGLMCYSCTNVSSPEHCQQSIECGQGEICFTRGFLDHNGLQGFHLGCEDNRTCQILREANALFGRRAVTDVDAAPSDRCYQCCFKDECNNHLCQGETGGQTTKAIVSSHGVTCMSCEGVESPEHCRQTTVCGINEICFTREYTDAAGRRSFHLGCENQGRCTLFLNAQTLFGKRHLDAPAPEKECYDCCPSDECNIRLCPKDSGGHSSAATTTQTTTVPVHSSTSHRQGCFGDFVPFENNCYMFENNTLSWNDSRKYCQEFGADLLSIHSKEENNFVERELLSVADKYGDNFWTGGSYSHSTGKYEWTDGSPFDYTNWYDGYPPQSYHQTKEYHVIMGNPHSLDNKGCPMWVLPGGFRLRTVCKK